MKRRFLAVFALIFPMIALVAGQQALGHPTAAPGSPVPTFEVDSTWRPRLPSDWVTGVTSSVAVDKKDHLWILHRPHTVAVGQIPAPPVLEFDATGDYIQGWGGPASGYEWPDSEHGIYVDDQDGVWITGSSRSGANVCGIQPCTRGDDMLNKFTSGGKFQMAIGRRDQSTGAKDTKNVHAATDVFAYAKTNDLFVSDGYQGPGEQGDCRVIVFDAQTGAFKRMWGAFGDAPQCLTDSAAHAESGGSTKRETETEGASSKGFSTVHCVKVSNDGLVYVCDRPNNRIQVFTLAGKYLNQVFFNGDGSSSNSATGLAFSPDPGQKFMYVADYGNSCVVVLERKTLQVLYKFGNRGASPGNFQGLHSIAVDSKGNLYTAEVAPGNRVQRFLFKGLRAAPAQ
ncbi:MAG: hypothetical protein WCC21_04835 [Candidatus Acidiferrales bacterium]